MRMHAILCLIKEYGMRTICHFVRNLLAAVRRQTMQHQYVSFGLRDQFNDLTGSVKKFTDQLATALKNAAEDIMTLEVRTYAVDDLEAVAQGDDSEKKLRAFTRIEFDGDMDIFVPTGTGKMNEELRQIHLDMVREAQANRAQFLTAMAEMATNLLKSLT